MCPVAALMPTTAALHRHLAAAAAGPRSVPDRSASSKPQMLKYLIFTFEPDDLEQTVVFDSAIPHKTMVPEGATPISAGFLCIYEGHLTVPQFGSDTLNLDPRPQDKAILQRFLNQ